MKLSKENIERKTQMLKLISEGLTYEEISQKFGVTKQRVYAICGGRRERRAVNITEAQCVYPNLREYMIKNKCSITELTRALYGDSHATCISMVRFLLQGGNSRKKLIDGILALTGMTYEKAFEREGD